MIKKVFKGVLSFLIFDIGIILLAFAIEKYSSYAGPTGWDCPAEEFQERYLARYTEIVEECKSKNDLSCSQEIVLDDPTMIRFRLYTEDFTIHIDFGVFDPSYGSLFVNLYYYGEDASSLYEYEEQAALVCFITDVIKACAYEPETDKAYFPSLYEKVIQDDTNRVATEEIHYDDDVGHIGYEVWALYDGAAGLYKGTARDTDGLACNRYRFLGLLKASP